MGLVSRPGLVKANVKGKDKSLLQMGHYGMGDKLACVSFLEDSKKSGTSHISKLQSIVNVFDKATGGAKPKKPDVKVKPPLPKRKRRTSINTIKRRTSINSNFKRRERRTSVGSTSTFTERRGSIEHLMPQFIRRMQVISARGRVEKVKKNEDVYTRHRRIISRKLSNLRTNAHTRHGLVPREKAKRPPKTSSYSSRYTSVILHNNRLTSDGLVVVMLSLPKYVVSMDVSSNIITRPGKSILTESRMRSLAAKSASENPVDTSLKAAAKVMESAAAGFQLFEQYKGLSGLAHVIRFGSPRFLTALNLEDNQISDHDGVVLIRAILSRDSITTLNMSRNRLGKKSVGVLATSLSSPNCRLKRLDISWNTVSGDDFTPLFAALCWNHTLQELNVSWNSIGGLQKVWQQRREREKNKNKKKGKGKKRKPKKGKKAVKVVKLKQQQTTTTSDINDDTHNMNKLFPWLMTAPRTSKTPSNSRASDSGKEVQGSALEFLCLAFKVNKTLNHINLSACHFDYEDCKTLAAAIRTNRTIRGLHFSMNSATVDSKGFICPINGHDPNLQDDALVRKYAMQKQQQMKDAKEKDNKGKDAKGKNSKGKDTKGKDTKGKDTKGKDTKEQETKAKDAKAKETKQDESKPIIKMASFSAKQRSASNTTQPQYDSNQQF